VIVKRGSSYGVSVYDAAQQFVADFGGARIADLDRPRARAWALAQPQSRVRAVRAMLNDAIDDGLHPGPNPLANLRREQPRGRKDLVALTEPELHALADVALSIHGDYGQTFRAMILFAGFVGLRPGELAALERADVRGDEVTIRQSLDGTGALKLPKNGKARVVILPPPAREALLALPSRLDSTCLGCSSAVQVVSFARARCSTTGIRCVRRSAGQEWTSTSFATSARRTSWNSAFSHADVAVQLGHTDGGALVMSTYGHPSEDLARARLKRACAANVVRLPVGEDGLQEGSIGS
jgi:integrase